ncbi:hypothetical protein [Brevibacillus marinus]|uniref:hypothetical protein n=1 Tax=Brevibacillus marinus TaxID=2496837 RepID=UPI000F818489|nr:hypothetical protein [Brevibacillus marinus]
MKKKMSKFLVLTLAIAIVAFPHLASAATKYVKKTVISHVRFCEPTYNYVDQDGYQGTLELVGYYVPSGSISFVCYYEGYVRQNIPKP